MTQDQLSAMIDVFLDRAKDELDACNRTKDNEYARDSWIAHMTASTIFGVMAEALIMARRAGTDTNFEDMLRNIQQLKETEDAQKQI